ncbi:MAG: TldD/PmbA family protein [Candidatus Hodarchaeota archaeon]
MEDLLSNLIDRAQQLGADYADSRYVTDQYEVLNAKNGSPFRMSESYRCGIGLRVLINGAWGFASTNDLKKPSLEKILKKALKIAEITATITKKEKCLNPIKTYQHTFLTPVRVDPFTINYEDKIHPLTEGTKILKGKDERIRTASASMISRKYSTLFISSEGSSIDQKLIQCGASITGMLMSGSGMSFRTSENYRAQGFEFIDEFDLIKQADIVARDLKILADSAENAPSGQFNLLLEPSHLGLVIHESIGHPTELDRILGREADFAGTSFLEPKLLEEKYQYGSNIVNIVHDPTKTPALGTYGYDDDGIKAKRVNIIDHGILKAFQTDRITSREIGLEESSGNSRAHGHDRIPIDRMANLYFDPDPKLAYSSFDELLEETKNGILAMYSRTHSISPNRSNFQFTTQMGYTIENGELNKPLKNVVYGSRTLEFWKNCLATTKAVEIFGTPNCGKGNPGQTIWTSHGGSYSLFQNIRIGA